MTELWAYGLVILAVIMGAIGPVFIKKGSNNISLNLKKILKNKYLIAGILTYVASSVVYIIALTGGELSTLAPIISLSYVIVAFLSIRLLNERMNKMKWIGIALIMIGVSLVGLG